jgi:hypothetical protein
MMAINLLVGLYLVVEGKKQADKGDNLCAFLFGSAGLLNLAVAVYSTSQPY